MALQNGSCVEIIKRWRNPRFVVPWHIAQYVWYVPTSTGAIYIGLSLCPIVPCVGTSEWFGMYCIDSWSVHWYRSVRRTMAQPSSFYISKGSMHVLSFEVWYKIGDRTQVDVNIGYTV